MIIKERKDKSPKTKERRDKRIEKKLIQLSKDHPENSYEVREITDKKDHIIIQIKRTKGRRPHKIKNKDKKITEDIT
jgi:hypothetical protein